MMGGPCIVTAAGVGAGVSAAGTSSIPITVSRLSYD